MTGAEAGQAVAFIAAAYPRQPFSEATIEVYAEYLADLDYEPCVRAIKAVVATSKFPPTIADIRREYVEQDLALPGPQAAWELVVTAERAVDLPPEVLRARDVIGGAWALKTENHSILRSQFVKAYAEFREDAIVTAVKNVGQLEITR